jgi:hypothetical protein
MQKQMNVNDFTIINPVYDIGKPFGRIDVNDFTSSKQRTDDSCPFGGIMISANGICFFLSKFFCFFFRLFPFFCPAFQTVEQPDLFKGKPIPGRIISSMPAQTSFGHASDNPIRSTCFLFS